jgi:hypothetical protein
MSIIVTEKMQSRPSSLGENAGCDLLYTIKGTADDAEARLALLDEAPETYYGLVAQNGEVDPEFVDVSNPAISIWTGKVHYARKQDQEAKVGDESYEFDTTGGTEHVTQSLKTIGAWASGGPCNPERYLGAIGVTPDGVEGVDIVGRVFRWNETHILDREIVNEAYKYKLFKMTGTVNSATFRGKAQGEVLFLGARGAARGDDDVEITFQFAASPNKVGLTIGAITGINKRGWEYLWVRYIDDETDDGMGRKVPFQCYVEQVYEYSDFSQLGIGVAA